MSFHQDFPDRRGKMYSHLSPWALAITLSLSAGCKNTDPGGSGMLESPLPQTPDSVGELYPEPPTNEDKAPQTPTPFRIVRVDNELNFAILQNVNGSFPRTGTELDVYRGSEIVGRLKAGSQAEETFFSADIIEGTIQDSDIAFQFDGN